MMVNSLICGLLCIFVLGYANGAILPTNSRTCVIGAGYSGLATARYLKENGVKDFTVFEATRHLGGTWRFEPNVGVDEDGVPVFSSMYKYLRTNTPTPTMEFAKFPFPSSTPSYPTGTCFYKYIKAFAKEFGLEKYIKYQSLVTSVKRVKDHWTITYTDTANKVNVTEECGYVVVAKGQLGKPKFPTIEGEKLFRGSIMHSHDYKGPEPFADKRVLLIGAGPSGLDLASHLANKTKKLIHSHHLKYNQPFFSKTYVKKPDLVMFTENGAVFEDGSYEEVDQVIYCTGFELEHSLLDESSGVTKSNKFILPLYRQIVNIRYPTMFFVGIAKTTITRLLDTQAAFAAAMIAGQYDLPSQSAMLKSWLEYVYYLQMRGKKIIHVNVVGDLQDQYFANLTQEAGVERTPPVLTDLRDFNAKIRLDDLLHYREYDYNILDDKSYERFPSPLNGTTCPISD